MAFDMKRVAMELRIRHRMSVSQIAGLLGISKSSASIILRGHPLSDAEQREKINRGIREKRVRPRGDESALHAMASRDLSRRAKGWVAESAVALRLALVGYEVFSPLSDGNEVDLVARSRGGRLIKIQVKWASVKRGGAPLVKLERSAGGRYGPTDFDFIVGYDLYADTAYVFSAEEASANSAAISVRDDAAERWDKLPS